MRLEIYAVVALSLVHLMAMLLKWPDVIAWFAAVVSRLYVAWIHLWIAVWNFYDLYETLWNFCCILSGI